MKDEMIFGVSKFFDGAPNDAEFAAKEDGYGIRFYKNVVANTSYEYFSSGKWIESIGNPCNPFKAMRRIIKEPVQHSDDTAVDLFAAKMKEKLEKSRDKGRRGWESCPIEHLITSLKDHISKGDPVDVANFAMMISQRGESIKTPVWTEIDRRSKKLPPVGVTVKWVNESYTVGTVGATYPDVGTDVLILAETDNAKFSKKGVVFKWHTKHGVLTSFTTRAMDFSPIETPEEKAARLRSEWINKAYVDFHRLGCELEVLQKEQIKQIYDALLSGELTMPGKVDE